MFDEIISYLPPSGEVCLSLTCKEAIQYVGTAAWVTFRGRRRLHCGWGSLCEILQRDVPGFEYCAKCETLHGPMKPPHAHRTTKLTKHCLGQEASIDYWPQTPSGGYSIVFAHIREAFESKPANSSLSPPINLFDGDFTLKRGSVEYRLASSARWMDGNFVVMQKHRLRTYEDRANGALLTHAIKAAFPENLQQGVSPLSAFCKATPSEEVQIATGSQEQGFVWRCRSCPTKFLVEYRQGNGGELDVTAWHCFGKGLYQASKFWKMFVHREGLLLGPKKLNSEYSVTTRSVPDFKSMSCLTT
ncbi:hypothetical protein BJX99DRAFT_226679 [Aspergillus californicus]